MNSTTLNYDDPKVPLVSAGTHVDPDDDKRVMVDARSNETSPGKDSRWVAYIDKRLDSLKNRPEVPEDPEDYPKPPLESIVRARILAWEYFGADTPTPNVVPSTAGGVEFIWYKGDWHLKIRVESEGALVWAHNLSTGDLWEGSLEENSLKLRELLGKLAIES